MKRLFLVEWIVANIIGFTIGNILGNGDWGLVTGFLGDLLSGTTFGAAQSVILARYNRASSRLYYVWWTASAALGYMFGVFFSKRITPWHLVDDYAVLVGAIFGIIIGLVITAVQWAVLRRVLLKSPIAHQWILISMVAWIIGEALSGILGNVLGYIVLFGLLYGIITGFFWNRQIKAEI